MTYSNKKEVITVDKHKQSVKEETFRRLHQPNSTFVLPNAWDAISAKMFQEAGFKAIGTTSAGIAASLGYKDGESLPLETMIAAIERITKTVDVPVSADIEAGYGKSVKEVVQTVERVVEAGAIGINLEDGIGNSEQLVFELESQKEKILAIKEWSSTNHVPLFINARTDIYWLNVGEPSTRFAEASKRAKAYQEAGADCIFIPGLTDQEAIKKVRGVITCPINLLADAALPSLAALSTIGIERVSCGSAQFRATTTLLQTISEEILTKKSFHHMTDGVLSYGEIAKLMQ